MANTTADNSDDRRDVTKDGSSLSGSTKRNNDSTEKALHPEANSEAEAEVVDQDPGERQKENQNQEKDDPLAA